MEVVGNYTISPIYTIADIYQEPKWQPSHKVQRTDFISSQPPQYIPFVEQHVDTLHEASMSQTHLPTKMSSKDESARLFQTMVTFKYVADNKSKQSKDILVNRDTVAQHDVRAVIILRHSLEDPLTWLLFRPQ
jgi:hypothetical protein